MISHVTKVFDEKIKETYKRDDFRDLMNWLLNHERKQVCLEHLCENIRDLEARAPTFNYTIYNRLIKDVAVMFMRHAMEYKEQEFLTEIEKKRRIQDADLFKEMKKEITEGAERVEEI